MLVQLYIRNWCDEYKMQILVQIIYILAFCVGIFVVLLSKVQNTEMSAIFGAWVRIVRAKIPHAK
jgi:preprotein translocase subunit SecG